MSQSIRQSELFAGSDWQVLYRAFTDVNFNASDPPSINRALRNYIQQTYPENFNDWIESSEFVALIDLLSWLAGTLAFKTDLNARESFLETAETRESILRLARFISYNPRRNQCAQGIVKLVEVMTNDDVIDASGINLNNSTIQWDNPDDPDWFERFILVLNSTFISTNQYGVPLKSGNVAGATTQLYRINNIMSEANLGFSVKVGGTTATDFELVNPDFDDGGGFYEREPDYNNAFHMFYRNDGNGNSSAQTGFFMMFKQGTLAQSLFNVAAPIENNVMDINVSNVNDTDVWVQTVTDSGTVLTSWSKVPAIFNENITYNNYDPTIRNIFSVITRDTDQISVRFSDGRFGAVPTGNIRVFYRTSNGLQYQIRPSDLNRVKIQIPYYNRQGVKKTLSLTFSLQQSIANSTPRETDEQIKSRAPSVYATQNRMVSGEDYNTFPLQSNLATKLKAINRIYSGHSRYIDLNDPTGNYQDVNVFSDDGLFYREPYTLYTEVPLTLNASANDIVALYMQPMLNRLEVLNLVNEYLLTQAQSPIDVVWMKAATDASFSSSGYFVLDTPNSYIVEGASILFNTPTGNEWATVVNVTGPIDSAPPIGSAGPVTLSVSVANASTVESIIPSFTPGLDANITASLTDKITNNLSFTLWYDYSISPTAGPTPWVISPISPTATMFQIMEVNYAAGGTWSITAAGARFVFESLSDVQWYDDGRRTTDEDTGVTAADLVRVLKVNEDLRSDGQALGRDYDLNINRIYFNRDGSTDPKRVTVSFADANLNGYADDPDTFDKLTSPDSPNLYLFWQSTPDGNVPLTNSVVVFETETLRRTLGIGDEYPTGTVAFQITSTITTLNNSFWIKTGLDSDSESGWTVQRPGAYLYGVGRGPNVAGSWIGNPVPRVPGIATDWWEEVLAPVWITPGGTIIGNIGEFSVIYMTLYAQDPQGLTITYTVNQTSIPDGILLDANTGVLSGLLPDVDGEQTWTFDVIASNGVLTSTREFSIRAVDAIQRPTWVTTAGSIGVFVSEETPVFQFDAINDLPLAFTVTNGALPDGVTLTPDGQLTGTLPVVTSDTTYTFTVRANNGQTYTDRTFSLVVTDMEPPVWLNVNTDGTPTQVSAGSFTIGREFGPMVFVALSGGSMKYVDFEMVGGTLPEGLIFTPGKLGDPTPFSGEMHGIPAEGTEGVYFFTLRATAGSHFVDAQFTMTIG